ncbi:LytTR family transcriptional regulator [Stenotrophomonas sp. ATCM1_4]|uniref:LytTR family DNA-binding domain-containing protein n=1 Tax=Stenotrophomonas sp. ATCM1_4 TaxID=2259330 RepID=UPI00104BCFA8|nr:LytTR family DNA-binding domain-containing protein [Stenotrophomonas sp. ATCM1_4]TDB27036.1 LytTR family transcriptional regulator [Stenotrophomonas sp. ATCM1_4]
MEQRPALDAFTRFRPWRRRVEVVFWLLVVLLNCSGNAITTWMDANRSGRPPMAAWEPWVWEFSSGLVWLFVLVPAIVWLTSRFPLHRDNWRQRLPGYLLASVPASLLHVLAMFGLRMLVYRLMGEQYRVHSWGQELLYEYLKDIRTLVVIVGFIEGYRFLLRRLQGEAQLLAEPDEGPPVEPIERPERLLVRKLGRDFLIATEDIEWAQAAGNYVNLRVKGHDYPLRITMAGLEERLAGGRFIRVHRSWMVQIKHLVSIRSLDGGEAELQMDDGQVVPCSRRYLPSVRQTVGEGAKAPAAGLPGR